jgi:hypothetical protein
MCQARFGNGIKILIASGNPIETWVQIQDHGCERGTFANCRGNKKPRGANVARAARLWGRVLPMLSCAMLGTVACGTGGRRGPERPRNGWPNEPNCYRKTMITLSTLSILFILSGARR